MPLLPHPPNNPLLTLQQKLYYRLRPWRDWLVIPLVWLCATLRLTPNNISLFGLVAMVSFVLTIRSTPLLAVLFIAISVLCDATDGALARYLKIDSDKGKLVDITTDAATFTLFTIGLVVGEVITPQHGLLLAATMFVNKALRIWRHSRLLPSAWHFRAVAGFIPTFASYMLYISFALFALGLSNHLSPLSRATIAILAGDTFITLFLLYHKKSLLTN